MEGVEKKNKPAVILLEIASIIISIVTLVVVSSMSQNITKLIASIIFISTAIIIGFLDFIITRIVDRKTYYDNSIFYHAFIYAPKILSYLFGLVGILYFVLLLVNIII